MTIKTKCDIGDRVYLMMYNRLVVSTILKIKITLVKGQPVIAYIISNYINAILEENINCSAEEVFTKLKKDVAKDEQKLDDLERLKNDN